MKLSHKFITFSVATLMGVSPVIGTALSAGTSVYASTSSIHNTYGKNSQVKTIKNVRFVNKNGKKTNNIAEKGGVYTIWNVKKIKGNYYFSIQSNLKYWLPASATKGSVQYKDGKDVITITAAKHVSVDSKTTIPASINKNKSKATSKKATNKKVSKSTNKKKTTTYKLVTINKAQVYDQNGKKAKTYMGGKKWTIIGKNVKINGYGRKTIKGVKYYALAPNHFYVKADDVKTI